MMRDLYGFFIFVGVVLTHELGHFVVAKKCGYKLDSFLLAPYGVSLNYKERAFDNSDEIKIALAGPCVNLALALLAVNLWWLFPETYGYTLTFVTQSIYLALFNLLPAYPLDGGRVFIASLEKFVPRKKAVKISIISNVVFSCIFFILFIISCFVNFNPTFALACVFLVSGILQGRHEAKYERMQFFKKNIKNFSRARVLSVKADTELGQALKNIETNKVTIFYVLLDERSLLLDEKTLIKWSMLYPLSTKIYEIIK